MNYQIECWSRGTSELAESPLWDAANDRLWWVDILRGAILSQAEHEVVPTEILVEGMVGAVALAGDGKLALATSTGFRLLEIESGISTVLAEVESDNPDIRMNDAKVDPFGCFWGGTTSISGKSKAAALYRLNRRGRVTIALTGLSVSNGLGWSPDGSAMYLIDSPTKSIRTFEFPKSGTIHGGGRVLVDTECYAGTPDGMCVDAQGCLWVCFWEGWNVRRFSPLGDLLAEIELPVSMPTSCCFGGRGLDQLFITTARHGLSREQVMAEPLAGSVLRARPGIAGLASSNFRWSETF